MQEECDFQVTLEKKLSVEARLDAVASSTNLSETEMKKSVRIYSHNHFFGNITLIQRIGESDKLAW